MDMIIPNKKVCFIRAVTFNAQNEPLSVVKNSIDVLLVFDQKLVVLKQALILEI